MIRLLITVSYYLPNISGLTIYARNLAEALSDNNFFVKILTSKHEKKLKSKENINGVEIERVWTPFVFGRGPIMPTYFFHSFISVIRSDVVNCHLPQFEAIITAFWAKILRKKLIVTYHCDLSIWPGLINRFAVLLSYLSHFLTCLMAEKIVVNSRDYAQSSRFLLLFKRKLIYVYPPVKLGVDYDPVIFGSNKNKYKVGFVGRIAKEKGLQYLLGSIKYLNTYLNGNIAVYIAGPGEEVIGGGHKKEIASLLAKYSKSIFLLGTLSDAQLNAFYKMLDVFVLPSVERMESFGMTQVEAMLSGCPVVVNDLPGAREAVLKTGMGEVVNVKDSEQLAKTIAKVIKNKESYVKHQNVVEEIFNHDDTINLYEKLFKTIS